VAGEGSLRINISSTRDNTTFSRSFTDTFDVGASSGLLTRQNIGTSDETLSLGDVSSNGYIFIKNCDATNYVELGHTSGTYFGRLNAGEGAVFRCGAALTAIHAKANTGACDVEYLLLSN